MDRKVSKLETIYAIIFIAIWAVISLFCIGEMGIEIKSTRIQDAFFILILGGGIIYIIIQCLRLASPIFGLFIGIAIVLSIWLPALIALFVPDLFASHVGLTEEGFFGLPITLIIAGLLGVGMSILGRKLKMMSPAGQIRVWGLVYLGLGIILFMAGEQLPNKLPWNAGAWISQSVGAYIGAYHGVWKIFRGR
ncbi:MAG: hypothetical protein H8D67_06345 [Deltaproteobacteria bacterium]|nr:hypothetical protein [Deltaproteobacteria bacterium]